MPAMVAESGNPASAVTNGTSDANYFEPATCQTNAVLPSIEAGSRPAKLVMAVTVF
jgi:hypothetical protein